MNGRADVSTGIVPDYRTFVRHFWTYEEPGIGSCLAEPPWVYACIFEDDDEALLARAAVRSVLDCEGVKPSRVDTRRVGTERGIAWEVRFADLEALHRFLAHVAAAAQFDPGARQLGEFLMWTLGFRWV